MAKIVLRTLIPFSDNDVKRWHMLPGVFCRSFPPSEAVECIGDDPKETIVIKIMGYLKKRLWRIRTCDSSERGKIVLKMLSGPLKSLVQTIKVCRVEKNACELIEEVEYELHAPYLLGSLRTKYLEKRLRRFFAYKHNVLTHDLSLFAKYRFETPLKILVCGASGLIGTDLCKFLTAAGHHVHPLPRGGEIPTQPDVVINLAGANVAAKRWSKEYQRDLIDSRVNYSRQIIQKLKGSGARPKVFLSASAIASYMGSDGAPLSEGEETWGEGFLSKLVKQWESVTGEAEHELGSRTVSMRFGLVLSAKGGALKKMLGLFRLGLGGILGSGKQYVPWISLDDAIAAIYHAISTPGIKGAVNTVSPMSITNRELSESLSNSLGRSLGPRVSTNIVSLLYGQMGRELLLESMRPLPTVLQNSGFIFRYVRLDQALSHNLQTKPLHK